MENEMATAQIEIPGIPHPEPKQEVTALTILHDAVNRGASIDAIERLAALQEKMLARQAEIEFNEAMNAAQSELGRIAPNLTNPQTKSKYASYDALDRVVRPIYVKHGFSLSFDAGIPSSPNTVRAFCFVSHRSGHTRKYQSPDMPLPIMGPQGKPVMTETHGTGAAMSYAMRYLVKYIFNIAIGEDDNDGNVIEGQSAKGRAYPFLDQKLIEMSKAKTLDELNRIYKSAYAEAFEIEDMSAMKALVNSLNRGKEELSR